MKAEDQIQAEIFKWYRNNHSENLIFSVPNGGTRNIREAILLKATGLTAGVSDLIVIKQNEVIFVEVKTEVGKQSKDQKAFEQKVNNLGFKYFLVRSLDEFIKII
jgi:hypothetical protein